MFTCIYVYIYIYIYNVYTYVCICIYTMAHDIHMQLHTCVLYMYTMIQHNSLSNIRCQIYHSNGSFTPWPRIKLGSPKRCILPFTVHQDTGAVVTKARASATTFTGPFRSHRSRRAALAARGGHAKYTGTCLEKGLSQRLERKKRSTS